MVQILSGAMFITSIPSGPFETNCYIYPLSSGDCFIIDAPPESYPKVLQHLQEKNLKPTHLLLTHSHWDHIADASLFKEKFPDILIAIDPDDIGNLQNPGSDLLPCWIEIEGVKPDILLNEGDSIGPLKVIRTPGHTPGGVSFYDEENKILFSGDTLFKGSIGNISFPTARPQMMWKSLEKLATLPAEVKVFPGHGDATTIKAESWLPRAKEIFGN